MTDTMAQSYLHNTSRTAGAAAEVAADKKTTKYAPLVQTYVFVPLPWKPWEPSTATDLNSLATWEGAIHKSHTDDIRESAFLFQRLSVLIQRYNAVAIQGTFVHTTSDDEF